MISGQIHENIWFRRARTLVNTHPTGVVAASLGGTDGAYADTVGATGVLLSLSFAPTNTNTNANEAPPQLDTEAKTLFSQIAKKLAYQICQHKDKKNPLKDKNDILQMQFNAWRGKISGNRKSVKNVVEEEGKSRNLNWEIAELDFVCWTTAEGIVKPKVDFAADVKKKVEEAQKLQAQKKQEEDQKNK